jgi:hypothetical protein
MITSLVGVAITTPRIEPVATSPAEFAANVSTAPAKQTAQSDQIEFDKQYVDQFADRTKWLETIAYAALVGLVGLRWSRENLVNHATVAIAAACLTVSLFNGYRAHDQILQALQTHTPHLLATTSSRVIVAFQFWLLVLAIALLATRVLSVPRSPHHGVAATAVFLALLASPHADAQANAASNPGASQDCVRNWLDSRYSREPTAAELKTLVTIVDGTSREKKISRDAQAGCAFSESILDYVANGSYGLNGDRDYLNFMEFADDLAHAISSHGFSDSPFQTALWTVAEIWHQPRGVLRVRSTAAGDEVMVDGTRVGLTPLTCAIAPGRYRLQVSRNGKVVGKEQIEVTDGQEVQRSFQ